MLLPSVPLIRVCTLADRCTARARPQSSENHMELLTVARKLLTTEPPSPPPAPPPPPQETTGTAKSDARRVSSVHQSTTSRPSLAAAYRCRATLSGRLTCTCNREALSVADNKLFYGDNLEVLHKHIETESVDLVYLDPPFNSNRNYNVLFGKHNTVDAHSDAAQIQAFGDTWVWTPTTEEQYVAYISGGLPNRVADALTAFRTLLGENDAMAYLVNMAPRLVELHRALKPTGSLYLHCDPTMSHYLKIILDAIFDARYFQNEISWKRFSGKNDSIRFGRSHDVILFYSKSKTFTWNKQFGPFEDDYVEENYRFVEAETGRRYRRGDLTAAKSGGDVSYEWQGAKPYKGRFWAYSRQNMDKMLEDGRIEFRSTGMPVFKRYLDEQPGVQLQDFWADIRLQAGSNERLGYPTQKPVALMERVLTASSHAGDMVLDPFCGCGITIEAAVRLKRK